MLRRLYWRRAFVGWRQRVLHLRAQRDKLLGATQVGGWAMVGGQVGRIALTRVSRSTSANAGVKSTWADVQMSSAR
jgi:hypothetical protein